MIRKKLLLLFIFCFISLIFPSSLQAHPHVFIDNQVEYVFDKNGLAGISVKWVFDEMYSSSLIMDYDQNKDNSFNPVEISLIQQKAFANLKSSHYFIYIRINGKGFTVKEVTHFSASIDKNKVVYYFFIPCILAAGSIEQELKVSVYDESYYVEVTTKYKNAVRLVNPASFSYSYSVTDDEDHPYYYDQVLSQVIDLKFKK